jgi:uncharacterized membrane protein (DUF2068 family)
VKKLIALVTLLAGLPGLAGIYLLFKLGNLPSGAVLIIVNAIVFRGVCGTLGGVLLWTGRRIGSYLALVTWSYLLIVSVLTLISLYEKGLHIATAFRDDHLAAFGKPLAWSVVKLAIGIPVFYYLITDLMRTRKRAA